MGNRHLKSIPQVLLDVGDFLSEFLLEVEFKDEVAEEEQHSDDVDLEFEVLEDDVHSCKGYLFWNRGLTLQLTPPIDHFRFWQMTSVKVSADTPAESSRSYSKSPCYIEIQIPSGLGWTQSPSFSVSTGKSRGYPGMMMPHNSDSTGNDIWSQGRWTYRNFLGKYWPECP